MIFTPIQIIRRNLLKIPYYICAGLGLHNGVQMHLSVFKATSEEILLTEVISSPIPLEFRSDLWVMKASFYDRPGLLSDLTTFLKKLNIDIVSVKGSTSEHNKYCQVEFVLDNQLYQSDIDRDSNHRTTNEIRSLEGLKAKITAYFIEDILFSHNNKPLITIYRNIPLYRSITKLLDRDIVRLVGGSIKLPKEIMKAIEKKYLDLYPEILNLKGEKRLPLATLVADTENAILKTLIFYRNTGHVHIRIKARNIVGALSSITTRLNNAKFNIYQINTRNIETPRSFSLTDLLIYLPIEYDKFKNDTRLKQFLMNIFKEKDFKDLETEVSFPKCC